jgi:hypothetical protein
MAGSPFITPRDAYPLYFAVGRVFAWLAPGEPAFALNLASAVEGALASGLLVLLAIELTGSLVASVAAALLFAGSYTFWSQSVIAEVYALHITLVVGTLLLLLRWEARPTGTRLALFFTVYALGFGNHLSMILLAPAYACFLIAGAPLRWRSMLAPHVLGLAILCAVAGALQYTWNLRMLWLMPVPPASVLEGLKTFWFDVTKSDWRDTMVWRIPSSAFAERLRMYSFDLDQQFGWIGPLLAAAGVYALARRSLRRALLVLGVYLVNVAFALGYNVGDSHVFFLPSHLMLALLVAPGLVLLDRAAGKRGAVAFFAVIWAVWGIYDNFPALDRSGDTRPVRLLTALTAGLDERHAVLLTDLNWQIQNGLSYLAKETRPDLALARMPDVLLYAPALIRDNTEIGRDIVFTERAAAALDNSYGPLFAPRLDREALGPRLSDVIRDLPQGAGYVLCVLRPDREFTIDQAELRGGLSVLTGGRLEAIPAADYVTVSGTVGNEPLLVEARPRPFRAALRVDSVRVEVRMESWLAFDTIRRMGFGHVIANRRHALIVERGVSFVAFDKLGRSIRSAYAGGLFEPQPRYVIQAP